MGAGSGACCMSDAAPLGELRNVTVRFDIGGALGRKTAVIALDQVTLSIRAGEVVGLVGESGSGKSTAGRLLAGLLRPTSGDARLMGTPSSDLPRGRIARMVQMIFQDPSGALNPKMSIGAALREAVVQRHRLDGEPADPAMVAGEVRDLLGDVGLSQEHVRAYPHQFSGGQKQRIGIARALALRPQLLIADEPVSALDVSVQAQVINLLMELRARHELAYLFISHDIGLVRYVSDRICVMAGGRLVEEGEAETVCRTPRHPETQRLLAARIPLVAA